jgi:hypothetical protein
MEVAMQTVPLDAPIVQEPRVSRRHLRTALGVPGAPLAFRERVTR